MANKTRRALVLGACGLLFLPVPLLGSAALADGLPVPGDPETNAFRNACPVADADREYRFVVAADSRGPDHGSPLNADALAAVFSAIGALDPQPRFVFFVGDLSFGFTDRISLVQEFESWQDTIRPHYPASRVYPAVGTHERVDPANSAQQAWAGFRDHFDPVGQERAPGGEPEMSCHYYNKRFNPPRDSADYYHTVYYCDFADDRFFVLNNDCIPTGHSVTGDNPNVSGCVGHELGCGQFNWVRKHLADNRRRHNFFFHHEPAFGTGSHNADGYDDPSCPNRLAAAMDNKKASRNDFVRLVGYQRGTALFSGHEHQYTWRSIHHQFVHNRLNNPERTRNSFVLVLKATPPGQQTGPATAYSYDGSPTKAPRLRLWWTSASGPPDWEGRIKASRDDAEQFRRRGGEVYLDSSDLELMRDPDRGQQRFVGLRWTSVKLPPDRTIERAEIQFTARADSTSGPRVEIRAEADAFPAPFS